MKIFRHKKKIFLALALLLVVTVIALYVCDGIIENATAGRVYSDVENIPANHVGLLLGTGKYLKGGAENPYYRYRIDAAAALHRGGKIKNIWW